jgi:hypothetical protein
MLTYSEHIGTHDNNFRSFYINADSVESSENYIIELDHPKGR